MADTSEKIRAELEFTGSETVAKSSAAVQELTAKVYELDTATYELAKSYEHEEAAADNFVRQAVEQTQAQRAVNLVLEETSEVTAKTGAATAGFGRGILQTSYAVQDFTSVLGTQGFAGALNSVQNNIPVILTGLGVGSGLAGVVSVLAVGAGLLVNNWSNLTAAFGATPGKLPELKEGLEGLKDSLKDINEEIEKLEKQSKKGGPLDFWDAEKLEKLKALRKEGKKTEEEEELIKSTDKQLTKRQREDKQAATEAIEAAGGTAAIIDELMQTGNMGRGQARGYVTGALRGDIADIQSLQNTSRKFARFYAGRGSEAYAIAARNAAARFGAENDAEMLQHDDEVKNRLMSRGMAEDEQTSIRRKEGEKRFQETRDLARQAAAVLEKQKKDREQRDRRIEEREDKNLDLKVRGLQDQQKTVIAMARAGAVAQQEAQFTIAELGNQIQRLRWLAESYRRQREQMKNRAAQNNGP